MPLYIIDRFEEGFALLEDDQKALHRVPRDCLPPAAKEGDCLRFDGERYTLDEAAAGHRRARIQALLNRLTKKPREE